MTLKLLPWPARSPDLKLLEHVWDMTGKGLGQLSGLLLENLGAFSKEKYFIRIFAAWKNELRQKISSFSETIDGFMRL